MLNIMILNALDKSVCQMNILLFWGVINYTLPAYNVRFANFKPRVQISRKFIGK